MWRCSCQPERWRDQLDGAQFCPQCGDAKPYLPDGAQIARFQMLKQRVASGVFSEQIERPGPQGTQEVS